MSLDKLLKTEQVEGLTVSATKRLGKLVEQVVIIFMLPFDLTGVTVMPAYLQEKIQGFWHKLGNKLVKRGVEPVEIQDFPLVRKIIDQLKFEELDQNIISEILCEMLLDCIDPRKSDDLADYPKYISILKNLYPRSILTLYQIKQNQHFLKKDIEWKLNVGKELNLEGEGIFITGEEQKKPTDNSQQVSGHNIKGFETYDIFYSDLKQKGNSYAKYIDDLHREGLISNIELSEKRKVNHLYFSYEGKSYQSNEYFALQQTYKYFLKDLGEEFYNAVYTEDVIKACEKALPDFLKP